MLNNNTSCCITDTLEEYKISMSAKMEIVDQYVKDSNLSLSEKSGWMTIKTGFSTMYEAQRKSFSQRTHFHLTFR